MAHCFSLKTLPPAAEEPVSVHFRPFTAQPFQESPLPMPVVESASREAFLILAILRRIPVGKWITTPDLEAILAESGYSIARRRLQRLLKDLSEMEEFCIQCDTRCKPFAYRRTKPDADFCWPELKPKDSLVLSMVREHLKYQLPQCILDTFNHLFIEAQASLEEDPGTERASAWLNKVACIPEALPMKAAFFPARIFESVSNALFFEKKLDIAYTNALGDEVTGVVSPLGLIQQGPRIYLVCRFDNYDNIRHLALHRISRADVLDFAADFPPGFSLDAYLHSRHFNFSNGQKIRLVLEFTNAMTAKILAETPFAGGQTLTRLPDGAWRLEAVVDDTVLVDGWIASWTHTAGIRKVEKLPAD